VRAPAIHFPLLNSPTCFRDRNGKEFVEIHLATKVVDTDGEFYHFSVHRLLTLGAERIRNTLSHEMCHLACWIIDKEIKEAHGKIFNKWQVLVSHNNMVSLCGIISGRNELSGKTAILPFRLNIHTRSRIIMNGVRFLFLSL
jgi:hypothetical protein